MNDIVSPENLIAKKLDSVPASLIAWINEEIELKTKLLGNLLSASIIEEDISTFISKNCIVDEAKQKEIMLWLMVRLKNAGWSAAIIPPHRGYGDMRIWLLQRNI